MRPVGRRLIINKKEVKNGKWQASLNMHPNPYCYSITHHCATCSENRYPCIFCNMESFRNHGGELILCCINK